MRILVVGLVKGKQITRFKQEAEKLGHQLEGCHATELTITSSGDSFLPTLRDRELNSYNLIYLCTGIEMAKRFEWYAVADYLHSKYNTQFVNEATINPEYRYYPHASWFFLQQFEASIPFPKTVTFYNSQSLKYASSIISFPAILKLADIHKGKGVFKVNSQEEAKKVVKENPSLSYLLREFIPNDGDIRVFTVGYKAIGAMKRLPAEGEFRSNISIGGHGEPFDLETNAEVKDIAEKISAKCGIEVAGVDIIIDQRTERPYVLEVNVGPQFEGLEKYTNTNAAMEIIKYFESKVSNNGTA